MQEVTKIVALGVILAILQVFLRDKYGMLAVQLSAAFAFLVFLQLINPLREAVHVFARLSERAHINSTYLSIVLKTLGIAYITSFGVQVSKDAGEQTIAFAIELAGKIVILMLAVPILIGILDMLVGLIP